MLSKLAPSARSRAVARNLARERRMVTMVTELSEAALKLELEVRAVFSHEEDRNDDDDGSGAAYRACVLKKVERISSRAVHLCDAWDPSHLMNMLNNMDDLRSVHRDALFVAAELTKQYCKLPSLAVDVSNKCSQIESVKEEMEEVEEEEDEEETKKRRIEVLSDAVDKTKDVLAGLEKELKELSE